MIFVSDMKGKSLNLPQSFLKKQLQLLFRGFYPSWARVHVHPGNMVHKAPFLQQSCLRLSAISRPSAPSPRLFAARPCTCCLCCHGTGSRPGCLWKINARPVFVTSSQMRSALCCTFAQIQINPRCPTWSSIHPHA